MKLFMKYKILSIFGILIAIIFVFRVYFLPGHLAFGDAPFFYPENLNELFYQPLVWDFRNDNFGGSQLKLLWLYIPTFLIGLLNHYIGGNHDIWIRVIFYFPALLFSIFGSWLYAGIFTRNQFARILAAYLYTFNTYILMVVDGGQIGISLAYGLFPNVIYFLSRYFISGGLKNFLLASIFIFLLMNSDIRIFSLAAIFYLIQSLLKWLLFRGKIELRILIPRTISILLMIIFPNLFWIIPSLINISNLGINHLASSLNENTAQVINGLLLFHPQFFLNEFGNVMVPPFYFGILPIIIFSGLIMVKTSKITQRKNYIVFLITFLIFVFFTKGKNDPFGGLYSWVLNNLYLGIAFRDSTKFFTPLILASSIILALVIEMIRDKFSTKTATFFVLLTYVYLSILIFPAFKGNLSGVLSLQKSDIEFQTIYQMLHQEDGFFRTLWFPERPPLGFSDWSHPAISANVLHQDYPFANMIVGDYDLFHFLHSPLYPDWLRLLGIKYVFFPEDQRKKTWSDKEIFERGLFEEFVGSIPGFTKLTSSTKFPGFRLSENTKNKIFTQNKALIVSGDADIYKFLKEKIDYDLTSSGTLFLEDGILDANSLFSLPDDAAIVVSFNRSKEDLKWIFLKEKFLDLLNNISSQWGIYDKDKYISWKAELNKNGISSSDLGFKQGLIYSSIRGEKVGYKITSTNKGVYYLAVRNISNSINRNLKVNFAQRTFFLESKDTFSWALLGPIDLNVQEYKLEFENLEGFHAINTIAFFNKQELENAKNKADILREKFGFLDVNNDLNLSSISAQINIPKNDVTYTMVNPTKYNLHFENSSPTWVVFSDHYNKEWKLNNLNSYPSYSMINGFWLDKTNEDDLVIEYRPQKIIPLTVILSVLGTMLILGTMFFLHKRKDK